MEGGSGSREMFGGCSSKGWWVGGGMVVEAEDAMAITWKDDGGKYGGDSCNGRMVMGWRVMKVEHGGNGRMIVKVKDGGVDNSSGGEMVLLIVVVATVKWRGLFRSIIPLIPPILLWKITGIRRTMAVLVPSVEVSSVSGNRLEFPANFVSKSVRSVGNQTVWKKNSRGGVRVRVRVCSRIKDSEVEVSDLGYNLGLYGLFSAPEKLSTTSLPKQSKEEEEKQNYHVNTGPGKVLEGRGEDKFILGGGTEQALGYVVLKREVQDSDCGFKLTDDIVFKDPLNTFVGIENYKSIFWALRFHGRIFFRALWLDIVSVWQPAESIIMVRWTAHGIARVPWESCGRFDGTSEYKLDKHGKIYEHRVHNIALNAPPRDYLSAVLDSAQKPNAGSSRQT
ncbi:DUF2358 family protein [Actinidia rufa]|uniref:DUF2358 family protein n=1 Tax=Actinidia rufa TaxID=165716 RepID=A0A7J0DPJ1_9ERIC|nr:DUF2358 family protein [Actinidia rufa]